MYTLIDGVYMKTSELRKVNYTLLQPEISPYKNCIAAITSYNQNSYPWITIPCDESYDATYICQEVESQSKEPGVILNNQTYGEGWLTLEATEKCYLFLDIKKDISFYDSQKVCSSQNASVFTADISNDAYPSWKYNELKEHMRCGRSFQKGDGIPEKFINMKGPQMQSILFGRHVDFHSLHNLILPAIRRALIKRPRYMTFFAYFHHSCTIVHFSLINYFYDDTSHSTRGWGVKCRPCTESINVYGILCEKPRERNTIECASNQFKCRDGTCILYIYKCHSESDCFDGTDEINCVPTAIVSQFIILSCFVIGDCVVNRNIHIRVQGICDGMHMNDTILDENKVCDKLI